MPKLLALFQRLRQITVDVPELRVSAEDGLEELVELLQHRANELQAGRAPDARGSGNGDTREGTKEFVKKQVIKKTNSHLRPGVNVGPSPSLCPSGGGSQGDLQVFGQFTKDVVVRDPAAPGAEPASEGSTGEDVSAGETDADVASKQRERQRRRDSQNFLHLSAERTVYAGVLATTNEEKENHNHSMIMQFKEGFVHFKNEVILQHRDYFRDLANAQHPTVMVIACCDSRVDPALLLGAGPGDIFMVRNIANLVPPFERQGNFHGTSAALEYAVRFLKVKHIMILGHKNCGGVKALMTRTDVTKTTNDFIDNWMEIAAQACERTRIECGHLDFAAQCAYCERESVNVSLSNLLTFPFIKQEIARKALELHGWYYDLESAMMDTWQLRYQISDYERLV